MLPEIKRNIPDLKQYIEKNIFDINYDNSSESTEIPPEPPKLERQNAYYKEETSRRYFLLNVNINNIQDITVR